MKTALVPRKIYPQKKQKKRKKIDSYQRHRNLANIFRILKFLDRRGAFISITGIVHLICGEMLGCKSVDSPIVHIQEFMPSKIKEVHWLIWGLVVKWISWWLLDETLLISVCFLSVCDWSSNYLLGCYALNIWKVRQDKACGVLMHDILQKICKIAEVRP